MAKEESVIENQHEEQDKLPPLSPQISSTSSLLKPKVLKGLSSTTIISKKLLAIREDRKERFLIEEKLKNLKTIDSLYIHRDYRRAFFVPYSKDFHILNSRGRELWLAEDASNVSCCYGTYRVNIKDLSKKQIICLKSGFNCCLEELEVYANSILVGKAKENFDLLIPRFSVVDRYGVQLYKIKRKGRCGGRVYQITGACEDAVIGNIKIICNTVYEYEVHHAMSLKFPVNLDVDRKALLIGASFLIGLEMFLK